VLSFTELVFDYISLFMVPKCKHSKEECLDMFFSQPFPPTCHFKIISESPFSAPPKSSASSAVLLLELELLELLLEELLDEVLEESSPPAEPSPEPPPSPASVSITSCRIQHAHKHKHYDSQLLLHD
jgi:hypothetical protein